MRAVSTVGPTRYTRLPISTKGSPPASSSATRGHAASTIARSSAFRTFPHVTHTTCGGEDHGIVSGKLLHVLNVPRVDGMGLPEPLGERGWRLRVNPYSNR